jgi:hypothetical protein
MAHCDELAALLEELDAAEHLAARPAGTEEVRIRNDKRVEELVERIRSHRKQHAECDYKPTVQ